jgi:hypothetical protein
VREEHNPVIADELMEIDGASRRVGLEVGGDAAQAKTAALLGYCSTEYRMPTPS